jgi:hypothetical protein
VAAGLSLWLLLRGLFWWLRHRHTPASERPPFWHWPVVVVAILALAGDLWGLVLARKLVQIEEAVTLRAHYRESRQRFVLPEDFRYGEQLFPKGTLINRYDAFDNGERQRPLGLRGLSAARFTQPVQIAGAWVSAIGNGVGAGPRPAPRPGVPLRSRRQARLWRLGGRPEALLSGMPQGRYRQPACALDRL